MDIIKTPIEIQRAAAGFSAQIPVEGEALIPGAGRESVTILACDARFDRGDVHIGDSVASVDGSVEFQVLYRIGDETRVRSIPVKTPIKLTESLPGATKADTLILHDQIEQCEAVLEGGRLVTRAILRVSGSSLHTETLNAVSDIVNLPGVEKRMTRLASRRTTADTRQTASVSEEFELPAGLNAEAILLTRTFPRVTDTARKGNLLYIKGDLPIEIWLDVNQPGQPIYVWRGETRFSGTIELPVGLSGDATAQVSPGSVRARIVNDESGDVLKVDTLLPLDVRIVTQDEHMALSDAYSTTDEPITVTQSVVTLPSNDIEICSRESVKVTLPLSESLSGGRALGVMMTPIFGQSSVKNGKTTIDGVMDIVALYTLPGDDYVKSLRAEAEFSAPFAGTLPDDTFITLSIEDATAQIVGGDRLETRGTLILCAYGREYITTTIATEVSGANAEPAPGLPASPSSTTPTTTPTAPHAHHLAAVTLLYAQPGDTLWTVGKSYALPQADIQKQNPGMPSHLTPGQRLLLKRSS